MNSIHTIHARSVSTTDRVTAAWAHAPSLTRRAVVAACVTSAALATVGPAPLAQRWCTATVGVLLTVAALVDVHEHRLPNRLLAAAFVAGAVGAGASLDGRVLLAFAAGALLGGGLLLAVRLARGVGMGDVKMAAVVGASAARTSLVAAPIAIAIAAFVAATFGLLAGRRRLPLGPSLWFGWAVAVASAFTGWLS